MLPSFVSDADILSPDAEVLTSETEFWGEATELRGSDTAVMPHHRESIPDSE